MLIKIAIILLITQHIDGAHNISCDKLLAELANYEMVFVNCAMKHAVPVKMCTRCTDAFASVRSSYTLLKNNTDCAIKYFDKDRINLVASTEAALRGLWTKAYCDDCNQNNTEEFTQKSSDFYDCLKENEMEPCKKCVEEYVNLNTFYISLDQHNNGKVCFDIQDSMNYTRNKWSKELNCCPREFRMTLFTVALCIVSCLPFLFYGGTYLLTKRQERNHGILNDEDPLFSTSSQSSSNAVVNLNVRTDDLPSSSTQRMNRPSEPTKQSKGFTTLDEEYDDDSDEDNLASKNKLQ